MAYLTSYSQMNRCGFRELNRTGIAVWCIGPIRGADRVLDCLWTSSMCSYEERIGHAPAGKEMPIPAQQELAVSRAPVSRRLRNRVAQVDPDQIEESGEHCGDPHQRALDGRRREMSTRARCANSPIRWIAPATVGFHRVALRRRQLW
jgi:hypothetical protein